MKCKYCGCTDEKACPGGCFWVTPDVCSQCYGKKVKDKKVWPKTFYLRAVVDLTPDELEGVLRVIKVFKNKIKKEVSHGGTKNSRASKANK